MPPRNDKDKSVLSAFLDSAAVMVTSPYYNYRDYNDNSSLVMAGILLTAATSIVAAIQVFTNANPLGRCFVAWKQLRRHEEKLSCADTVDDGITKYADLHQEEESDTRNSAYKQLVNSYYDLATVFYEWGWGESFHFAPRYVGESFWQSMLRHEYQLASFLGRGKILDVGCGIGGPLRHIGRFLIPSCEMIGITINPYQVERGNELCKKNKSTNCKLVQGDFMKLPFEENSFDAAFSMEATCHAPDRTECYKQVYKVLKPGAVFASYDWCLIAEKFDPTNTDHLAMKKDIEIGNGLADISTTEQCVTALQKAGFEVTVAQDVATLGDFPWYHPLTASWNPLEQRFQFNPVGAVITNAAIWFLEFIGLAPKGTVKTQVILQKGAFALRAAGQEGIFTTMYLVVGKKPETPINKK